MQYHPITREHISKPEDLEDAYESGAHAVLGAGHKDLVDAYEPGTDVHQKFAEALVLSLPSSVEGANQGFIKKKLAAAFPKKVLPVLID